MSKLESKKQRIIYGTNMVRFCLNSIGRKRYFGQTDILLVASEKYRQLPYKNILRVRGNDERFTRLLPPPEGSGFPPMANEDFIYEKLRLDCLGFFHYNRGMLGKSLKILKNSQ